MTEQHTEAHRPHVARKARLIPLGVLVTCVLVASLLGVLRGGEVSAGERPKRAENLLHAQAKLATKAMNRDERRRSVCTPGFSSGHRGEPWTGAKARASERAFDRAIAAEQPKYVQGRRGWLFFSDEFDHNFSQALGRSTQSKSMEKAWAKYIARLQKRLSAAGAEFHMVVAPANWDVYHKNLPAWAQPLRGSTSLEHLMRAYPKLPWIDTRQALVRASKAHATYQPLDSHWTPYGGWVAWRAITRCLRTNPAFASAREPAITGVGVGESSNEFSPYGVPSGKPADTFPIFAAPHPATSVTHIPDGGPIPVSPDGSVDQLYSPYEAVTPRAISPLSLLVLRDSTGNALSPLWDWTFARTISYRHMIDSGQTPDIVSLARTYHPDVVLFVMTERFLYYPPPKR